VLKGPFNFEARRQAGFTEAELGTLGMPATLGTLGLADA
jgi:uncharacterized ferritin-like protein (DUF455 family)